MWQLWHAVWANCDNCEKPFGRAVPSYFGFNTMFPADALLIHFGIWMWPGWHVDCWLNNNVFLRSTNQIHFGRLSTKTVSTKKFSNFACCFARSGGAHISYQTFLAKLAELLLRVLSKESPTSGNPNDKMVFIRNWMESVFTLFTTGFHTFHTVGRLLAVLSQV